MGRAREAFGLQAYGVDLLLTSEGPVVVDVNAFPGFRSMPDADLHLELSTRGLRRAADFSWRRHTLETIAVLRRVHDQMRQNGRASMSPLKP